MWQRVNRCLAVPFQADVITLLYLLGTHDLGDTLDQNRGDEGDGGDDGAMASAEWSRSTPPMRTWSAMSG